MRIEEDNLVTFIFILKMNLILSVYIVLKAIFFTTTLVFCDQGKLFLLPGGMTPLPSITNRDLCDLSKQAIVCRTKNISDCRNQLWSIVELLSFAIFIHLILQLTSFSCSHKFI